MDADRIEQSRALMLAFAASTGLTEAATPRRYLWTDAHAVCNCLSLQEATGESEFGDLAVALVEQVHSVLGRYRADDVRSGWISGLDEASGREHPTAGGLRIGKHLPERGPGQRYDERAEWDQDGQYYHYLTRWMHALLQLGKATADGRYVGWAAELAVVAYTRFLAPTGAPRLFWKMSTDLSRPLVPASGMHDPVDGLVTATALRVACPSDWASELDRASVGLLELCAGRRWDTDDPLGVGGLLFDACRLAQLFDVLPVDGPRSLLGELLASAQRSLAAVNRTRFLEHGAAHRLAFRELGLSIGLHALTPMRGCKLPHVIRDRLDQLAGYLPIVEAVERFWRDPARQRFQSWIEHQDINAVMLATSLVPGRFLNL